MLPRAGTAAERSASTRHAAPVTNCSAAARTETDPPTAFIRTDIALAATDGAMSSIFIPVAGRVPRRICVPSISGRFATATGAIETPPAVEASRLRTVASTPPVGCGLAGDGVAIATSNAVAVLVMLSTESTLNDETNAISDGALDATEIAGCEKDPKRPRPVWLPAVVVSV